MQLDDFQKSVIAIISSNRSPKGPFGGSVIQLHGTRLTDDQDIVVADDDFLDDLVTADQEALEAAGFTVKQHRRYPGFRDFRIMKPMIGTTTLQWTAALANEYFAPVPDDLFGYRLHFVDLAVNKSVAAANKLKKRDFVDLVMLDRHVMPLWRMVCAAAGKRPDINPFSMVERISRNWDAAARKDAPGDRLVTTTEVSLSEIGDSLDSMLFEVRRILDDIPPKSLGRLQVDESGQPVLDREITTGGRWKAPMPGGALPAFPGMDSEMIAGLIAEYGPEGSRYTGDARPEAGLDKGG